MRIARRMTALIAAFALGSSSCATLRFGGGIQQTVSILTEPPGATVQAGGRQVVSPADVVLDRYTIHKIVATKLGYEMATATIGPAYSWATVLDLIFILPWVVDLVLNGIYTLAPESNGFSTLFPDIVHLVLTPIPIPQATTVK